MARGRAVQPQGEGHHVSKSKETEEAFRTRVTLTMVDDMVTAKKAFDRAFVQFETLAKSAGISVVFD